MKAKIYVIQFFFIALIGITVGCKKEINTNSSNESRTELCGTWNLVHTYGGISGADEQYAPGEVTWTFDNNSLVVQHNAASSTYHSITSGIYPYEVIQANGQTYLSINQLELGQFIISGNEMDINENLKSTGEGACGFYMELER